MVFQLVLTKFLQKWTGFVFIASWSHDQPMQKAYYFKLTTEFLSSTGIFLICYVHCITPTVHT